MKIALLSLFFSIFSLHYASGQYVPDWGKYLTDSINGADFLQDDESQQLVVDVKNASVNEEYVYVLTKTDSRKDKKTYCGANQFFYGVEDVSLAKYDKCGNLKWMRFIGTDNNKKNECGDFAVCLELDRDTVTGTTYIYISGYSYNNYDPDSCETCLPCDASNSAPALSCEGDPCVFQQNKISDVDAFIAKYDESGHLLKWTYFGGDGDDMIIGMDIFEHEVYITGTTGSSPGFIPSSVPKFDSTLSTDLDAFVAILDEDLCNVKFFSYMGGPKYERTHSVRPFKTGGSAPKDYFFMCGAAAGDLEDNSYLPVNSYYGGADDVFLSLWKLNTSTGIYAPQWMQYIGGIKDDRDREMILDDNHNAIITGYTRSNEFIENKQWLYPVSNFYDTSLNGDKEPFVVKFDMFGNPIWGTFFGGSGSDQTRGLATYSHAGGKDYVVISGNTKSTDLPLSPLHSPFQNTLNGGFNTTSWDAFLAVLTDPGSSSEEQVLEFSSYLGGKKSETDDVLVDYGPDVAVGGNNEIYTALYTRSTNIADCISSDGYHHNSKADTDRDGFLAKIINTSDPEQFNCTQFDWGNEERKGMVAAGSLTLFPNPTEGYLSVEYAGYGSEVRFIIYDVMGRAVFSKIKKTQYPVYSLDLSELVPGIYFLEVTSDDDWRKSSFVVAK